VVASTRWAGKGNMLLPYLGLPCSCWPLQVLMPCSASNGGPLCLHTTLMPSDRSGLMAWGHKCVHPLALVWPLRITMGVWGADLVQHYAVNLTNSLGGCMIASGLAKSKSLPLRAWPTGLTILHLQLQVSNHCANYHLWPKCLVGYVRTFAISSSKHFC